MLQFTIKPELATDIYKRICLLLGCVYVEHLAQVLHEDPALVKETGEKNGDTFNVFLDGQSKWNIGFQRKRREDNKDFHLSKKLSWLLRHNINKCNLDLLPGKNTKTLLLHRRRRAIRLTTVFLLRIL